MKNIVFHALSGIALIFALTALVLFYLSGKNAFDNSDALYLPVLFKDVLQDGGNFKSWYLTPAPYFFPDYGMYLLAYILGDRIYEQIIIFSLIQCLFVFGLIYVLARQAKAALPFEIASFITICLIWLAITVDQPYIFILLSAHHYGAFMSAILLVYLWNLYQSKKRFSIFHLSIICALTFVGGLSDNLFIVQAVVPFFLTCLLSYFIKNGIQLRKKLLIFFYPLIFGILGSISYKWLVVYQTRYSVQLGFDQFFQNMQALALMAVSIVSKNYFLMIILVSYAGVSAYLFLRQIYGKQVTWASDQLHFLNLFSLISIGVTISSVAMVQQLPASERYLISAYSWPIILAGLFAATYLGSRIRLGVGIASIALAIFLLIESANHLERLGYRGKNYPIELACLDNALEYEGLRNGIAQYWDAKALQAFSRLKLELAQHFGNLSEHRWITSARYFKDRYDFIILSANATDPYRFSREQIIALNGPPARQYECGQRTLLIYGKEQLRIK